MIYAFMGHEASSASKSNPCIIDQDLYLPLKASTYLWAVWIVGASSMVLPNRPIRFRAYNTHAELASCCLLLLQLEVVLPRIRIRECDPRPRHVIQAPASEVVVASIHSSHECIHICVSLFYSCKG